MLKITKITFVLAMTASPLMAQSTMNAAPIPGPYQVIVRPVMPAPMFNQQRFAPAMPYWMQTQPQPNQQAATARTPKQQTPAVSRAAQQPAAGWSAAPQAGQFNAPTPGFFPGTTNGQPARMPRPAPQYTQNQRPAPNYTQGFGPQPWGQSWGQPWGQQGYAPMPWGYGRNNNGYGYPPGYAPRPQQ